VCLGRTRHKSRANPPTGGWSPPIRASPKCLDGERREFAARPAWPDSGQEALLPRLEHKIPRLARAEGPPLRECLDRLSIREAFDVVGRQSGPLSWRATPAAGCGSARRESQLRAPQVQRPSRHRRPQTAEHYQRPCPRCPGTWRSRLHHAPRPMRSAEGICERPARPQRASPAGEGVRSSRPLGVDPIIVPCSRGDIRNPASVPLASK